jgi:hypothetical protein
MPVILSPIFDHLTGLREQETQAFVLSHAICFASRLSWANPTGCFTQVVRSDRCRRRLTVPSPSLIVIDQPRRLVRCRVPTRLMLDDLQDLDEPERGPETAKSRELVRSTCATRPMMPGRTVLAVCWQPQGRGRQCNSAGDDSIQQLLLRSSPTLSVGAAGGLHQLGLPVVGVAILTDPLGSVLLGGDVGVVQVAEVLVAILAGPLGSVLHAGPPVGVGHMITLRSSPTLEGRCCWALTTPFTLRVTVLRSSPTRRGRCDPHRPLRVGAAPSGSHSFSPVAMWLQSSPTLEGRCCGVLDADGLLPADVAILADALEGLVLPRSGCR